MYTEDSKIAREGKVLQPRPLCTYNLGLYRRLPETRNETTRDFPKEENGTLEQWVNGTCGVPMYH